MSEFKIESGVKLPPILKPKPIFVYPFDDMKVGDSFFIEAPNVNTAKKYRNNVWSEFKRWCRLLDINGYTIATRILIENDKQGLRIWLIKKEVVNGNTWGNSIL